MLKTKHIFTFLIMIIEPLLSSSFIISKQFNKPLLLSSIQLYQTNNVHTIMNIKIPNNKNENQNKSNIYKIDFTEEDEDEWLFIPKYPFGLSEYHIILLRIYTYLVAIANIVSLLIEKNNK